MAPHSAENTPIAMTGTQKDTLPSTEGGTAGKGHAASAMDKIKAAMGGAPWQVAFTCETLTCKIVHSPSFTCIGFLATRPLLFIETCHCVSQYCPVCCL